MKKGELRELYQMMFPEYLDIVTVKELREMLGIRSCPCSLTTLSGNWWSARTARTFIRRSCRNFCFGWLTLWSVVPNGYQEFEQQSAKTKSSLRSPGPA